MNWNSITLYTRIPFRLSYGVTDFRTVFWLRLTDDLGWGEAAIPPYYGVKDEDMIAFWEMKKRENKPLPEDVGEIPAWVGSEGPAPARCALDMALHDYLARRQGVPLFELLGLPKPEPVLTFLTVPLASPSEMAAMALKAKGFPQLKLKLGSDDDISRVAAVRQVRPDARLLVDANSGWSPEQAVENIRRLESFGVDMVEQPVKKDDFNGLAYVQSRVDIPVLADESVCSLEELELLAELGVRAINLKLMKVGGLNPCLKMIYRARELGIKIMLGCMIETSLGVTAMAHLSGLSDWIDLDGPLLISNDPFSGVRYDDAIMNLPNRPGIGAVRRAPQAYLDAIESLRSNTFHDKREHIFNVQIVCKEDGYLKACGQVLLEHQRQEVLASLVDEDSVENEIEVLLTPNTPWALVTRIVSDLNREPDCFAERMSQAILGDVVRILEKTHDWARVQMIRDGYLGWIQQDGLLMVDKHLCRRYQENCRHMVICPWTNAYREPSRKSLVTGKLYFGLKVSVAGEEGEFFEVHLPDGQIWWVQKKDLLKDDGWPSADKSGIAACLEMIRPLVGVPYLWGGCTPFGYDCSGLTQLFWSLMRVNLRRDADQQFTQGVDVPCGQDGTGAEPGDLVFFGTPADPETGAPAKVPHVALSLGGSEYIHANGTTWSLTYNSLSPEASNYRADLQRMLIGIRRYR